MMILVSILGFIFLISLIYIIIDRMKEKDEWNNGYCPKCGRPWDYRKYPVSGTIECKCEHCNYKIVIFKDTIKKD